MIIDPQHPEFQRKMNTIGLSLDDLFNADADEGEAKVTFVLIATQGDDTRQCAMIANIKQPHEIITLFLDAIAQYQRDTEPPVGHA